MRVDCLTTYSTLFFLEDPTPVLPTVYFDAANYVVTEGSTVTVNIVREDDGGATDVSVGQYLNNIFRCNRIYQDKKLNNVAAVVIYSEVQISNVYQLS